ncbi:MAG: hypothetical protein KDB07_11640, partial [Planctomycetes bacterium]|nr:hypothetical protein [Planctomycetota bacterium]
MKTILGFLALLALFSFAGVARVNAQQAGDGDATEKLDVGSMISAWPSTYLGFTEQEAEQTIYEMLKRVDTNRLAKVKLKRKNARPYLASDFDRGNHADKTATRAAKEASDEIIESLPKSLRFYDDIPKEELEKEKLFELVGFKWGKNVKEEAGSKGEDFEITESTEDQATIFYVLMRLGAKDEKSEPAFATLASRKRAIDDSGAQMPWRIDYEDIKTLRIMHALGIEGVWEMLELMRPKTERERIAAAL